MIKVCFYIFDDKIWTNNDGKVVKPILEPEMTWDLCQISGIVQSTIFDGNDTPFVTVDAYKMTKIQFVGQLGPV